MELENLNQSGKEQQGTEQQSAAQQSAVQLKGEIKEKQQSEGQTKAKQTKARQSKGKQSKGKQSKAKQSKAEQSKTEQSKAKQSKAEQIKAEQPKTKQIKAEQPKAEQPKTKQVKAEQSKAKQPATKHSEKEQDRAEQLNIGQAEAEQKNTQTEDNNKKTQTEIKIEKQVEKQTGTQQPSDAAGELEEREVKDSKPKRKRHIWIWTAAVFAVIIISTYAGIAVYYQSRFFPNTMINGADCSNLDAAAVAGMLESQTAEFSLEIIGRNEEGQQDSLGTIKAVDIDLTRPNILEEVNQLLGTQDSWVWFKAFLSAGNGNSFSLVSGIGFDEKKLEALLYGLDACQKKNMIESKNAYISEYSEAVKGYEIVPETKGTQLDVDAVVSVVKAALYAGAANAVDLDEQGCYVRPEVTAEDKQLLAQLDTVNKWAGAEIVYDWNGNEVIVDAEQIKDWIIIGKADSKMDAPRLNEELIAEFVQANAREFDTYGRRRNFTTTLGVELSLPGGAYGWKTDREGETAELIQAIEHGEKTVKEPVYISRGAQKGSNDIGSSYVEIDLSNQHLYLYQSGTVVLETDFVSGNMSNGNTTPPGVFGITYKTRNAVLRGADYETPVHYWMPFNGNVGMHDATWRDVFGGDIYLTNGSHGCVNLPLDMAEAIYGYMSDGFPVICYYY